MTGDRIKGAVYGFAFGDAWGKDTEFKTHAENYVTMNPNHLSLSFPEQALITDDTQMSLYALYAIMFEVEQKPELLKNLQTSETKRAAVRKAFADSFVEFAHDEDNNRAPGMTCMNALASYEQHLRFLPAETIQGDEGVHKESKGCGANMRVGWFGLLPTDEATIINLAILQSETTHGHPLALASSVLTALTTHGLYHNLTPKLGEQKMLDWVLLKINELEDELNLKNSEAPGSWSNAYRQGLSELRTYILNIKPAAEQYKTTDLTADISQYFGGGWVAEEAFITGLSTADSFHTNPEEAIYRNVISSGDSDSVAAFAGLYLGVAQGLATFINHEAWMNRLEPRYQDELHEIVQFLERNQN